MPIVELATSVVALVVISSLTGVEFCVAAFFHPVVGRLSPRAALEAHSLSAARLGAAMPAWYGLAALTAFLAACFAGSSAGTWLWSLVTAALAFVIVATIRVLVPINSAIARGAGHTAEADGRDDDDDVADGTRRVRDDIARWDRLHRLRTLVLAVVGSVEIVAVLA